MPELRSTEDEKIIVIKAPNKKTKPAIDFFKNFSLIPTTFKYRKCETKTIKAAPNKINKKFEPKPPPNPQQALESNEITARATIERKT